MVLTSKYGQSSLLSRWNQKAQYMWKKNGMGFIPKFYLRIKHSLTSCPNSIWELSHMRNKNAVADALIKVPLPLGSLSSYLSCSHRRPGNPEFRAVACLREACVTWVPPIARNSSSSFPGSKVPYAFMAAHQRPGFSMKRLLLSADLQTLGRGKVRDELI